MLALLKSVGGLSVYCSNSSSLLLQEMVLKIYQMVSLIII